MPVRSPPTATSEAALRRYRELVARARMAAKRAGLKKTDIEKAVSKVRRSRKK